jgi:hypothetical protein
MERTVWIWSIEVDVGRNRAVLQSQSCLYQRTETSRAFRVADVRLFEINVSVIEIVEIDVATSQDFEGSKMGKANHIP